MTQNASENILRFGIEFFRSRGWRTKKVQELIFCVQQNRPQRVRFEKTIFIDRNSTRKVFHTWCRLVKISYAEPLTWCMKLLYDRKEALRLLSLQNSSYYVTNRWHNQLSYNFFSRSVEQVRVLLVKHFAQITVENVTSTWSLTNYNTSGGL